MTGRKSLLKMIGIEIQITHLTENVFNQPQYGKEALTLHSNQTLVNCTSTDL